MQEKKKRYRNFRGSKRDSVKSTGSMIGTEKEVPFSSKTGDEKQIGNTPPKIPICSKDDFFGREHEVEGRGSSFQITSIYSVKLESRSHAEGEKI